MRSQVLVFDEPFAQLDPLSRRQLIELLQTLPLTQLIATQDLDLASELCHRTVALLKLCDDFEFYEQKRQSCQALQAQFYDISQSWGAALKSVIVALQESSEKESTLEARQAIP